MPRTLFALVLTACGTDDGSPNDPTDDTEDTDIPVDTDIETPPCVDAIMVTYAEGGCLGYPDQWEFKVDNAGCAASAVLALWDTATLDWDEEHPLTIGSEAPNGEDWQNWILGPLPHATPEGEWAAGVNTSLDCVAQAESVTTATRLLDANGTVVACAIWGHDPAAVVSGAASFLHTTAADYAGCEVRAF